jgi:hypothetical protein
VTNVLTGTPKAHGTKQPVTRAEIALVKQRASGNVGE